ncbi:MAG: transposase family protein, partial [Ruminococcus sp.]|nr:transposase family protein [Ruminococcus sp.]
KNKQYYICVIIDLFSRKVVGYNISLKNNTSLTKRTVREAYADRAPKDGLIFHSDNGSNYISNTFTSFLSELKIVQSFSKAGVPYDNSVCESFFKNMKTE